jgi:hypothetical protein
MSPEIENSRATDEWRVEVGLSEDEHGQSLGLLPQAADEASCAVRVAAQRDVLALQLVLRDAEKVVWENDELLAKGRDNLDVASMIAVAGIDRSVDEIRPFVEEVASRYREIRNHLTVLLGTLGGDVTVAEMQERGVLDLSPADEDAYELVWDAVTEEASGASSSASSGLPLFPNMNLAAAKAVRSTAEETSHTTLQRDADGARHDVHALEMQVEQTEMALTRVAHPRGVTGGVLVLVYMTTAGTLLPLGLMAAGVESLDWRGAAGVVVALATGIGSLVAYVSVAVRRLTREG